MTYAVVLSGSTDKMRNVPRRSTRNPTAKKCNGKATERIRVRVRLGLANVPRRSTRNPAAKVMMTGGDSQSKEWETDRNGAIMVNIIIWGGDIIIV